MQVLKKRSVAWCVLAVVVLLSLSLSGGGTLREEYRDTQRIFYEGMHRDGLSIDNDLKARALAAQRLCAIAADNALDAALIEAVETSALEVAADGAISARYASNEALTRAFDAVYDALTRSSASADDLLEASKQQAEFLSRADAISRDIYNEKAQAFNRTRNTFPTQFIALLSGVPELALFLVQ